MSWNLLLLHTATALRLVQALPSRDPYNMVLTITPSQESFILNLLDEELVKIDELNTTMAEAMVKDQYFPQTLSVLSQPISPLKESRHEKTVDFHIPAKRQKPSPEFDIKAVVSG